MDRGYVLRRRDVIARGKLPFRAHEIELALDGGFIGGHVGATHN